MTVQRRLGFAVKVLGDGGLPSHDMRRWQSEPHLRVSLERLDAILDRLERDRLPMYRLPSGFVPYGTHPDLPQLHRQLDECADDLARVGERIRSLDIRISMHPGQYVVLNSTRTDVQEAAVRDVEIHYSSPKTAVEERKVRNGRRVERSLVLPQLRAHADMIDPIAFEAFLRDAARGLEFDVMLEAKAKDLALLRLREQLGARGLRTEQGLLLSP